MSDLIGDVNEETKAQRLLRASKAELSKAHATIEYLERQVDLLTAVDSVEATAPKWMTKRPTKKSGHIGTANLLLSDLHLDEVVKPAEIGGVNAFTRTIAELRLRRVAERFIIVARDYLNGVKYDGACVWLGGDFFSGNIHEELKISNEAPILASLEFWIDPMVSMLTVIADEFGKVHCPGVVGNHGRNTRKPVAKGRVEDNFDWFFYRQLERALKDDKRFTFQLPMSADCLVEQYNTRFLFTHGDQFRGGGGISGLLAPLMTGDFRKRKRQNAVDQPYDVMLMGHWHQYSQFRNIIVNGSLKGYDEYAYVSNFDFEVPQQAFWVTTPEHGVTFSAPILCSDRKKEGW